jgi:hypothetical protein
LAQGKVEDAECGQLSDLFPPNLSAYVRRSKFDASFAAGFELKSKEKRGNAG